ncbi:MAG: sulfotransferase domain-containing protein, partial [Myxococcota bacterium]
VRKGHPLLGNPDVAPDLASGGLLATQMTYDRHVERYGAAMHGFVHVVRHPADVLLTEAAYFRRTTTPDPGRRNVPLDDDQLEGLVLDYLHAMEHGGPDTPHARMGMGSWAEHTDSWLHARANHAHILLRYEDLGTDPVGELRRVADFLRLEVSDDILDATVRRRAASWLRRVQEHEIRDRAGQPSELGAMARERIADRFGDTMIRVGYTDDPVHTLRPLSDDLRAVTPLAEEDIRGFAGPVA